MISRGVNEILLGGDKGILIILKENPCAMKLLELDVTTLFTSKGDLYPNKRDIKKDLCQESKRTSCHWYLVQNHYEEIGQGSS